jgi:hypothetical protein
MSGKSKTELIKELRDREFRTAYVASTLAAARAFQIDALRAKREWNQSKLGNRAKKPQSEISRLENPDYINCNVKTLLDIAAAFDVALIVKFVSFSRFLEEFEDVSPNTLEVMSFQEEFTTTSVTSSSISTSASTANNVMTDQSSTLPLRSTLVLVHADAQV